MTLLAGVLETGLLEVDVESEDVIILVVFPVGYRHQSVEHLAG